MECCPRGSTHYCGKAFPMLVTVLLFFQVDINLYVQDVTAILGRYIKYILDNPVYDPLLPNQEYLSTFQVLLVLSMLTKPT